MELSVNKAQKKQIAKERIRNSQSLCALKLGSNVLLVSTFIFCIGYALASIRSETAHIVNIQGVPTKDVGSIVANTILILAIGCFASGVLRALVSNLSSKNVNEREDESLVVMSDAARYIFRIKHHTIPTSRIVITIAYASVVSMTFDANTRGINMKGKFLCQYVENYGTSKATESDRVNYEEFSIYDYFIPSFYETMKECVYSKQGE